MGVWLWAPGCGRYLPRLSESRKMNNASYRLSVGGIVVGADASQRSAPSPGMAAIQSEGRLSVVVVLFLIVVLILVTFEVVLVLVFLFEVLVIVAIIGLFFFAEFKNAHG